jgi:putative membrane protein
MMSTLLLFISTILYRPYVFIFLFAFLIVSAYTMGWRRTFAFMLISWGVAFAAEWSSTRCGFPFGPYRYLENTRLVELYISNIPFMDSLSFTFLLYASNALALCLVLPSMKGDRSTAIADDLDRRHSIPVILLSAFLLAWIDVVIDPLAVRGDRWFLGKIFVYTNGGIYFGVPISNFLGWSMVGLVSLTVFKAVDGSMTPSEEQHAYLRNSWLKILGGIVLYYGVLVFNLSITFKIGEPLLGTVGVFVHLPVLIWVMIKLLD